LPPNGSEGALRALKILEGMQAAGDTHLQTTHWQHDYLPSDQTDFAPHLDANTVYTHGPYPTPGPTYIVSRLLYASTPAKAGLARRNQLPGCNDPVNSCSGVTFDRGDTMSAVMEEEIKRWTARRKSALVLEIIQGKTTVAEASRAFDITPSEIETWVEEGKRGLENALRAKPEDVREQYERQLKDLQEAYGEAMLELRARKKLASLLGKDET
jgi:transposase-like protein